VAKPKHPIPPKGSEHFGARFFCAQRQANPDGQSDELNMRSLRTTSYNEEFGLVCEEALGSFNASKTGSNLFS